MHFYLIRDKFGPAALVRNAAWATDILNRCTRPADFSVSENDVTLDIADGNELSQVHLDRRDGDEDHHASYRRGQRDGKRARFDKMEKLIDGLVERCRHWKDRAKSAEGQLRSIGATFEMAGHRIKVALTREQLREAAFECENSADLIQAHKSKEGAHRKEVLRNIVALCRKALRAGGDDNSVAADAGEKDAQPHAHADGFHVPISFNQARALAAGLRKLDSDDPRAFDVEGARLRIQLLLNAGVGFALKDAPDLEPCDFRTIIAMLKMLNPEVVGLAPVMIARLERFRDALGEDE